MRTRSSSRTTPAGSRRPQGSALGAGLRLLGRRAHSRVEMQRKLTRRGYASGEVDAAVARLDELGYLNDLTFAEGLVRVRSASRGPRALSAELAQRGVGRAQADRALASYSDARQLASAMRIIERTYGTRDIPEYREMLDRVGNRLLRLGFSPTIVRGACRAVITGTSHRDED
ncbi:MAG: regulatory protein RecX [Candidatus Dormibacteraceae bacterium]